ncbi:hypothetical protein Mal52_39140 [Symmachiella dynata]|uniref:Uncharacterized protein n=1 Tax=Symmachiella dynata TaxID=2527995 RepID=A0A517ZSK8_9PLAN|nr:hypothetical protein [Symmachiella dynata]QDU45420.1 hypothetical protein Mal52_39140 [Symmachiella dynata]
MQRRLRKLIAFTVVALLCSTSLYNRLSAEETTETVAPPPEQPFAIVAVASIERMLNALDFSFEAADRMAASEAIGGYMEKAGDLKGMDQRQGFGVMIFLAGITPQPIGFVPVENINDLLKTIEIGPFTSKKIDDEHYELKQNGESIFVKTVGRYAFFSNDQTALDREFPDPAPMTAALAAEYDVAAMLNLASLPDDKRDIFATLLKASADTNLQRRDNEPESAHRVRKALGENNARLLEQVLRQSQDLTVGWKMLPQQRKAALEIRIRARPGSELATIYEELQTGRSQFTNFLKGDAPLTFASTWKLDKPGQEAFAEIVQVLEDSIPAAAEEDAADDPVARLFRAARGTVATGQLDFALRFLGEPGGPFVLAGGLKVKDGRAMREGLSELCLYWLETGAFSDVEIEADEHNGIQFHRLDVREGGGGSERVYGGPPSMYLGVDDTTLWMAIGGDTALPRLFEQIDALAEPVEQPLPAVPLQFVVNIADWTSLRGDDEDGENNRGGRFFARVNEAFSQDNAALRIDIKSIQDGARLRLEFEEGFIRFFGMSVARRLMRE